MFLRRLEKLGNSGRKRFAMNGIASTEEVLTNEEGKDINKMRVECDLLERQIMKRSTVGKPLQRLE